MTFKKGNRLSKEQQLCACGCEQLRFKYDNQGREHKYIQGHNSKGENNNMLGKKRPDIRLYNLSRKGYKHKESSKKKLSETLMGKYYIEITKEKLNDLYTIKKLSLRQISKETGFSITALHNALKRFNLPTLHNNHLSLEKHPQWKGGKSFEPYGLAWTRQLKRSIRERDNNVCQVCKKHRSELNKALHIHHIDYIKTNNFTFNLISLCNNCHGLTTSNRNHWTQFFNNYLSEKYNYKYTIDQKIILEFT